MKKKVTRFPVDFEKLKKGDVLKCEYLERVFMISPDEEQEYRFCLLTLRDQIMRELEKQGRPVTVIARHDDLVILTDEEAAEHNPREFKRGIRRMVRAHKRTLAVDITLLSHDQKLRWGRVAMNQGIILQSHQTAKKTIRVNGEKKALAGNGGSE